MQESGTRCSVVLGYHDHGVYKESISLSSVDDKTKLEVTFDKTKMRNIGDDDLLWAQREHSVKFHGGSVNFGTHPVRCH
jgi:hypothetical protein